MHILWLSCAWKPGNYGPNSCLSRVAFWWNRNDATNFFYAFAARDSIVQIPVFFFFLSIFAQILRRFALGFFLFLFFFLESQPWQFHCFSPPLCPEDFSSIFQENAWRSFSSLKFCFSSRKGFPFHLSFSFFSFLKISRVIFSKHRLQNFSRLFEKSTFFVYTRLDHPLPRLFNPPLLHFLTSNFLPDNSLEQRSSFISAIINFRDSFSPSYLGNDSIREIYLEIFGKSPFSFEEEIWEASARGVAELESRLVG